MSAGWLVRQHANSDVSDLVADKVLVVLHGDCVAYRMPSPRCQENLASDVALRRFVEVYDDLLM